MLRRVVATSFLAIIIAASIVPAHSAPAKPARTPAAAKAAKPAAKPTKAPALSDYSQDQVDGVISATVDALWARTDYYWHRGDYPRIVGLDRVITEADPKFMEPYSTGGWLLESMGRVQEAEEYYRLGVDRNTDSAYMYYNISIFYFNTKKDYAQAVKASEIGVTKSDADVNDWRALAHAYEKTRQLDKALTTWKTMKTKYPTATAVDTNLNRLQKIVDGIKADGGDPDAAPPTKPTIPAQPTDNPIISL
ncbi:MAG TPA: tetratricopeptide repeat protein [Capsulimonadaceae bacterium]|jgi:tetratricopeptide (TPR) repeat protein